MTRFSVAFYLAIALSVFGAEPVYSLNTCANIFSEGESDAVARRLKSLAQQITHATDRVRLADELSAETRSGLRRLGVDMDAVAVSADGGSGFDLIQPHGPSALNRLSASIWESYGAYLVSYPEMLVRNRGQVAVFFMTLNDGRRPVFVIGPGEIAQELRGRSIVRTPKILHELRHLKNLTELTKRIPSAFYGQVLAVKGKIPDKIPQDFPTYSRFLAFDECETYHQEAKQELIELRRVLKNGGDRAAAIARVTSALSHGYVVSVRSRNTAQALTSATFAEGASGITEARATLEIGDAVLEVELPLVASSGVRDLENHAHFEKQTVLLLKTTMNAVAQFKEAGALLRKLGNDITVADVDKLQMVLNPLKLVP